MSETNTIKCVRCDVSLQYLGERKLVFDNFTLIRPSQLFDLYVCSQCGHVEFFDATIGTEQRRANVAFEEKPLEGYDHRGF